MSPKVGNLVGLSIFLLSILIAASLMFLIELLAAKLFLALLGGGPNVWNTSVFFFQAVLLAGYAYACLIVRTSTPAQLLVQGCVLLFPLITLPIRPPQVAPDMDPTIWLLLQLTALVGPIFFAIASASPLLQHWYGNSKLWGASDPYFLYAASNIGALLGLVSYPFLIEPNWSVRQQCTTFSLLYVAFAILMVCSGIILFFRQKNGEGAVSDQTSGSQTTISISEKNDAFKNHIRWLVLSMLPSSICLGVTTFVTTDMASFPLFWMIPLSIYLLSMIIAFSRPKAWIVKSCCVLTPFMVAGTMILTSYKAVSMSALGQMIVTIAELAPHLITLFVVSLACHGLVAKERPGKTELTGYFFTIALGGVLGSAFNTLIAPVLFNDWFEYPLALAVAVIYLIRWPARQKEFKFLYVLLPLTTFSICLLTGNLKVPEVLQQFMFPPLLFHFGIPVLFAFAIARNVLQLRLALLSVIAFALLFADSDIENLSFKRRNFFGCIRVMEDREQNICILRHGTTIHGFESLDPDERGVPSSYYTSMSPIANVMLCMFGNAPTEKPVKAPDAIPVPKPVPSIKNVLLKEKLANDRLSALLSGVVLNTEPIAVVGLGCGTMAGFARKGQIIVFYEIDPAVIDTANNPFCFTYLFKARKRGVDVKIEQGDARIRIERAPYEFYRLIAIDAFSSDSIPTHLLTEEALDLYLQKLKADGCLTFHISNSFYDLKPVLSSLASKRALEAIGRFDDAERPLAVPGEWVVLTRNKTLVAKLQTLGWHRLSDAGNFRTWTDDYSNPISLLLPTIQQEAKSRCK